MDCFSLFYVSICLNSLLLLTASQNTHGVRATVSSTFVSYFTSHTLLVRELGELRARAAQRALPQAPDGGGVILPDTIAIGDKPTESLVETKTPAGGTVMEELKDLGKKKDRTRWAKGQGLVGEVEEEGEMRDTWFRPGVPRREV